MKFNSLWVMAFVVVIGGLLALSAFGVVGTTIAACVSLPVFFSVSLKRFVKWSDGSCALLCIVWAIGLGVLVPVIFRMFRQTNLDQHDDQWLDSFSIWPLAFIGAGCGLVSMMIYSIAVGETKRQT